MDIGTVEVFFILLALLCGIAYGYLLGRKDATEARDARDLAAAPYAAIAEDDLYLLGFCDGVQAQKNLQQQQLLR